MEWNLYIEQDVFSEWPEPVDIIDAAIVKAIWQYQDPRFAPKLRRDDDNFVWLDQGYLVEQLPLLGLNKRGMRERLRRLCEEKFLLERRYVNCVEENGVRKRVFYHTTEEFDDLLMWFKQLHNIAGNEFEAHRHHDKKPDIVERLEVRKQRMWLHKQAHPEKRTRDDTGKFSTSDPPEAENSNPSNGTVMPHTAAPSCHTLRHERATDSSSGDSLSRNSSSPLRDPRSRPTPVDKPPIDFEARRAYLDRQAEELRRLEEAEVAKEDTQDDLPFTTPDVSHGG